MTAEQLTTRPQWHQSGGTHEIILLALEVGPLHRTNLAVLTGRSLSCVRNTLTELHHEGLVEPVGRGVWGLR